MHNIVHELAWSIVGDEFMFAVENKITFKKTWAESGYRYLLIIFYSSLLDSLNKSSCKINKV